MSTVYDKTKELLKLGKEWKDQVPDELQKKVANMYETRPKEYNPFLKKDGSLFNPYINYQKVLDNPNVKTKAKEYITKATGLTSAPQADVSVETASYQPSESSGSFTNINPSELVNMDVTKMPKLSTDQISGIISKHFSNSPVMKASDAAGIYEAQQKTGMSALAILGIGALESGWGTSNIAQKTNNIWGYGATNDNPEGNAHRYNQMSQGANQFASEYMNTYYNGYGAKSIYSAGTGNNPGGKGYAYFDNGTINSGWATSVGDIMKTLYGTASSISTPKQKTSQSAGTGAYNGSVGKKVANTSNYNNNAAKGQCVWYVRGRAAEKLGKDPGALGNANEVWDNARSNARLPATADAIRPNTIASYRQGTGYDGSLYGHVIFIEDVVGDTVYYTEGGSGYYQSGTDGVVKTASRKQILNGVDSNGNRFGSNLAGFIDLSKY